MLNENIKRIRKSKGLSQEELAIKLNVVRQTVSKWENGLSVPDSSMLIILANELDTTVSELLGEPVAEPTTDDLKILSEKLEVINLQLAKRSITKVKTIRWILISLCAVIVVIFIALASTNSFYLNWNYNDPELAVAGTILHLITLFFCPDTIWSKHRFGIRFQFIEKLVFPMKIYGLYQHIIEEFREVTSYSKGIFDNSKSIVRQYPEYRKNISVTITAASFQKSKDILKCLFLFTCQEISFTQFLPDPVYAESLLLTIGFLFNFFNSS